MAVEFRAAGVSPGANGTSCVIVKPVGLQVGDLMVAQVESAHNTVPPVGVVTAPASWASIREDGVGTRTFVSALFWKFADAADVAGADFTFTCPDARSNGGAITAWYGDIAAAPINTSSGLAGGGASTTCTAPTITPTVANCLILFFAAINDNVNTSGYAIVTDNPIWTERYDLPMDLETDIAIAVGSATRPEKTATGNGTATIGGTDFSIGQLVAIAPLAEYLTGAIGGLKISSYARTDAQIYSKFQNERGWFAV